ncbi:MAG: hypothetical protein R2761_03990 [Acidimicrobiales bacterium]
MSDQIFWYATRAAGILAWFAACLSVAVGVLMSSRFLGRRPTLPWLTDLHRFFAGMALVFVGLHMLTLWADDFISFSWRELLIPWEAQVRGLSRLALAMGVVSAWVMAVVELTSLVKRRLPARFWHGVHLGSYATVVLSTVHAWMVGSDATNPVLFSLSVSMLAAVVFVTLVRVLRLLDERKRRYDLALSGVDPKAVRVPVGAGRRRAGGAAAPERPVPPDPPGPAGLDPDRPVPPLPPDRSQIDPNRPVPPPPPDPSQVDPDRPVPPPPPDPSQVDPERPVPPPPPPNVALAAWPPAPPAGGADADGDGPDMAPSRPPAPSHRPRRDRHR